MANTRSTLEKIQGQLDESMGFRTKDSRPQLSPVANPKDVGRRALRSFGTLTIDSVIPDPDQPRTQFDEEQLDQLANSLREKGQLHPIRVRWSQQHGKWVIISGERRYRASIRAGLDRIECAFVEAELSRTEVLEQQLIENLLREDLKPIEEAKAFHELREATGWNGKQLAEAIRVTPSKVTRSLALLKLPVDIQQQVESGDISAIAAYELYKLESEAQIRSALVGTRAKGSESLTVAKAQNKVRQHKGKRQAQLRGTKQSFACENDWKVVVSSRSKGTYEEIEAALEQALEEVRLRIENNIQL